MLNIIDFINKELSELHSTKSDKELRLKLNILKKLAIYLKDHDVFGSLDEIIKLDDMNTGYSEYRIINDCESDDSKFWIEYTKDNEVVRLNSGDLLIKMK